MEQWWCRFTREHFSNKWLEFSPDGDATCVLGLLLSLALAKIIPNSNSLFAASHSCGTIPPCWRARGALGQGKERAQFI